MKRKTFLLTAAAVTVGAVSIPVIKHFYKGSKYYDTLVIPDELSRFCDEKTLREIGSKYRKMTPAEKDKKSLKKILLTDAAGKLIPTTDPYVLIEFLDNKIRKDFSDSAIVIVDGWIISKTEARQCALLSLT